MDIERLIERLQQYSQSLIAYKLDADFADACEDAVAALSTLQAENKKLRAELEHWKNAHHQAALNFQQENRECNKVLAELEQARAEITRLKHYEDKCHDCPIVCAKTEIIKAHEELEAVQNELEQKSKLIAQQAAELERRDKLLKEQETELDQMKRENETLKHALQNWHEED